jgi:hypothetical protein
MRLDDPEISQKLRRGLCLHRPTAIRVQCQLASRHRMFGDRIM